MDRPPESHFLYFLLADVVDALGAVAEDGAEAQVGWERYQAAASRIDRLLREESADFSAHEQEIRAFYDARRGLRDRVKASKGDGGAGSGDARGALRRAARRLMQAL